MRPNRILRTGAMALVSATLAVGAWGVVPARQAKAATYYSKGSLPPNVTTNWSLTRDGLGSSPANFTSGDIFVIQSGHTMTTGAAWSISGSGSRLQIENGGTLQADYAVTLNSATTFQIDGGGTYIHNNTTAYGGSIFAGTESFAPTSTIILLTSNMTGPSGVTFGNLTINFTSDPGGSVNCGGGVSEINGNLTVINTSIREFRMTGNTALTLTIGGDLIIQGGTLNFSNGSTSGRAMILNLGGSYNQTSGTFDHTNSTNDLSFNFTGANKTFTRTGGAFNNTRMNFGVNSGAFLSLNNDLPVASGKSLVVNGVLGTDANVVTGTGYFTLTNGATLGIGSPDGISLSGDTGSIRTTNRAFATTANYVYNGAAAQVTGNGLPSSVNSLVISNTAGVTLTNDVTISATLVLTGDLKTESNTLTMGSDATSSGEGDVVGSVKRAVTPGKSYSFGSPYVTIYFSSTGTISDVTVNLAKATPDDFTNAVTRTYTITPTGSGYTATLRLRYLDSELGENNANNLELWRFNSAANRWSLQWRTGPVNTTEKWIEKAQVTEFSKWVMADKGSPTAVTLSSFSGDSESFPVLVLTQVGLSVLAGLAATTVGQLRRRLAR